MGEGIHGEMIGDPTQIAFDLSWPTTLPADVVGLGWGDLVVWVGGHRHWVSGDSDIRPVQWTWVDLVEHLARAWGHLLYEENAPFGLVAAGPEELRDPRLLKSVVGKSSIEVEDAVHAYQQRHDLAAGLKGITLPPLWMLREGRTIRVRANGQDLWCPLEDFVSLLETLVEKLRPQVTAPRGVAALQRWDLRKNISQERVLSLRTALPVLEVRALPPATQSVESWWGAEEDDSPLMAAARLSQPLKPETRRSLLLAIARVPRAETPALDGLSDEVQPVKEAVASQRSFQQGYALALWLRSKLSLGDSAVDPGELLQNWGVHVEDLPELEQDLDAVACWGGKGPAVLVNPRGRHALSRGGRQATLAHEVAHLVLDRATHLPAAEVFGGSTPLHLEKRARAFAAELLLPREVAALIVTQASSLDKAMDELQARYGVSKEVVVHQIRNGRAWELLNTQEKQVVNRLRRRLRHRIPS